MGWVRGGSAGDGVRQATDFISAHPPSGQFFTILSDLGIREMHFFNVLGVDYASKNKLFNPPALLTKKHLAVVPAAAIFLLKNAKSEIFLCKN